MTKQMLTVRVDKDLYKDIRSLATEKGKTVTWIVRRFLATGIRRDQRKREQLAARP